MNAENITATAEIAASIPILISILALFVSAFTFSWTRDARRRKLVSAVYFHIKFTQENLENWKKPIRGLPDKMRDEPSYMPYFVVPKEDNLSYTDVIELTRWFRAQKDKETILRYFHAQANLHAAATSFGTEIVRNLPIEQKIRLADLLAQFCDETLEYAEAAKKLLGTKRKNGS